MFQKWFRSNRLLIALIAVSVLPFSGCEKTTESATERARTSGFRGITLEEPIPKVGFTLYDTEGEPFDFLEETKGYTTLLFFGYTSCPDVCPVQMANLASVLKDQPWEIQNALKIIFVTTDPERDTPERLRTWLNAFDRSFIGLIGSREEVNEIQASFGLPPAFIQGGTETDYIIGHASQVIAFEADDTARVVYPFGTRQADWAHDLPRLVRRGTVEKIALSHAAITEPVTGDMSALYLTITNNGLEDDELLAVTTELAGKTEIHTQVDHGGLSSMEEIPRLTIPAGERVVLEPGGYHIMLYDLKRQPEAGEVIEVELHLKRAGKITHSAEVYTYAELERVIDQMLGRSTRVELE